MIHVFPFDDQFILLDVESGAVHTLDETAYRVVKAIQEGEDPFALGIDEQDVKEIQEELEALEAAGALHAAEAEAPAVWVRALPTRPPSAPRG